LENLMTRYHRSWLTITLSVALISAACGQQKPSSSGSHDTAATQVPAAAPAAAKKEYVFRGKVESVDAAAKTMSVNGDNVEGWMAAMTMTYKADKPEVIEKVKVGDQITAKVYEGDFATLYDVQIVPPAR
jgi:Cu/Ag efflux protein CusF